MSEFWLLIAGTFAYCIKPGPGYLAEIARLYSRGWKPTVPLILGDYVANILYIIIVYIGFIAIDDLSIIAIIQILAGFYILYYTFKVLLFKSSNFEDASILERSFLGNFVFGVAYNSANPIIIAYYFSVVPEFMALEQPDFALIYLALFVVIFNTLTRALYLGLAMGLRSELQDTKLWKNMVAGAHLVFAGLGVYVIYSGLRVLWAF